MNIFSKNKQINTYLVTTLVVIAVGVFSLTLSPKSAEACYYNDCYSYTSYNCCSSYNMYYNAPISVGYNYSYAAYTYPGNYNYGYYGYGYYSPYSYTSAPSYYGGYYGGGYSPGYNGGYSGGYGHRW